MKDVVFKLKFNHPNKANTTKLNVNHFKYICTRSGAMYNDGKNFCCFGKVSNLGYDTFGEINDFGIIKNHIKEKSKNKTTLYKCVISLKEEDALKKNYDDRKSWEEMIKNNASKIAKQMGIKVEDFEYVCSVHMEKGHPHMHFMAWDKNQEILRTSIPKQNFANIRKSLTNYIFKDELQDIYNLKNESQKDYENSLKDMFDISDEDYRKILQEIKSFDEDMNDSKIFNINLKDNYIENIIHDIYLLKKQLPKTGRLNYKFMSQDIKNHLDTISKKIIANNLEVRTSYYNYIKSIKDVTEFSSKNEKYIDKNVKQAEDELLKFAGNQILKLCKEFNQKEFEYKKEEFEQNQTQFENKQILGLMSNLINFMTREENKNKNKANFRNKVESKEAKKELALKMQNKSQIDWENER